MGYHIEGGLITGPTPGQCAGYVFNFQGHGAYDPTGKVKVGDLELTQAQVDEHNALLGKAEVEAAVANGKGLFYLSWEQPTCTPAAPRWQQENRGEWCNRNYQVSTWAGTFTALWVYVKRGHSYGFGRFETRWIWFTGPDGKKWYGVQKGDGQNFIGRRLKRQG
jgi:hypothetical protein